MAIDETTVARVARLSRIALGPGEAPLLAQELNGILGWIDQLQAVDTDGVAAMTSVMPVPQRWRDDVVTDGNRADEVLANAPAAMHGFFAVPKVVE